MATKSDSIAELAAALAKAQGQMQAAKMASENPFLHNKYANLGDVIQAARKPMSDNGLSFTQHPTITDNRVAVTTMLMHASGQWIESEITLPLEGGKGISLAQSMGAVITYLRRYALSAILGIYADEDTDGNDSKTAQKPAQAQRPVIDAKTTEQPNFVRSDARGLVVNTGNKPGPIEGQNAPIAPIPSAPVVTDEWPAEFIQEMVIAYKASHANQIKNALKGANITPADGVDLGREWMRVYKANRESGMTTTEATAAANEAIDTLK